MQRHTHEDEAWIVLEGEVTFFLEDSQYSVGPGTYVFGPRGRAHTFRVESETARAATLISPGSGEAFSHATGRVAGALTLPPASDGAPDVEKLLAGMAEYGIEFISPPPGHRGGGPVGRWAGSWKSSSFLAAGSAV